MVLIADCASSKTPHQGLQKEFNLLQKIIISSNGLSFDHEDKDLSYEDFQPNAEQDFQVKCNGLFG